MKFKNKFSKKKFSWGLSAIKPHYVYWSTVIILLLTPILAFIYLKLILGGQSQSFKTVLRNNPLISIMIIVALIDLMFSYYLWQYHQQIIDQKKFLKTIYLVLLISQILLGNIFLVILASLGLYQLKEVKKATATIKPLKTFPFFLTFFAIIYVLCILLLAKVYLF